MDLYSVTEKFVIDAFAQAEKPSDVYHAQRTAYWIKRLEPEADEALLLAGLLHDIERAFHGDWKQGSSDPEMLRKHQELSAREAEKFLASLKVDKNLVEKVKQLITHHEEGGDREQDILCDADCLAFFEDKALRRVKKWKAQEKSKAEMKANMEFYFSRIISAKARELASGWHEEALREIEK